MSIKSLDKDELERIISFFEKQRLFEKEKLKKYGKVRSIIYTTHNDVKIIAIDNILYRSKNWKTFPDFLFEFVFMIFGKEWYEREKSKNYNEQHELFKWFNKSNEFTDKQEPNEYGLIQANPNGITSAFLLFSFDLFTVINNGIMIKNLIERLKDKLQFQGARYELFCLATCMRAGFKIELEDEKDFSKRHAEFSIYDEDSNTRISVEAKTKHRSGVLGRSGDKVSDDKIKVGKITQLINDAVSKSIENPLVIFLEFNLPPSYADYVIGGKSHKKIFQIFDEVKKTDDGKDFFNLVVLTNHPYHYGKDEDPTPEKIHSLMISLNPKHIIQNNDLLDKLTYATLQFGNIPNNFEDI